MGGIAVNNPPDGSTHDLAQSDRGNFTSLISEIASSLVDVRPETFDRVLEVILEKVGRFTASDGAYIAQYGAKKQTLPITHLWSNKSATDAGTLGADLAAAHTRAFMGELKRSGLITLGSPHAPSDKLRREQMLLTDAGIPPLLSVPLGVKHRCIGAMGLFMSGAPQAWTEDQISLLKITAHLVTSALHHDRIEEALSNERQLLRTVIDNLPDYIFAKDTGSRFILNNTAHLRLLKASVQEEVYGKTDYDIFPKELADQYFFDEQDVIQSGRPLVNREESVLTEEGRQRWLLTTKVAWRDSDGNPQGIVGMSRDITDRKEMAEEIEKHATLLEQANAELQARNQELDEFTYIASHDLQEPLRKQVAFSDALREDLAAGDLNEVENDLATITSAAKRMQTLVRDLLSLSRSGRQAMDWEEIDLNQCVEMALDALEIRIEQEKAVVTQDTLPTVRADKTLMVQLYQNLIGNAIKFHGAAAPQIRLTVESNAEEHVLGVADNGIGIKPDYWEQIFAPFKRLHGRHEYEGTGIGLAICRKIAERHGGRIWVESAPGDGSYFKFTVPVHPGDSAI
ncbi:MAG: PAS domain-containing protein [Candidatus Hydrogenedentes bacterium]|nr:PAS domain-containing protein [Candidatus Hydrogenedentota bacterium]